MKKGTFPISTYLSFVVYLPELKKQHLNNHRNMSDITNHYQINVTNNY